MSLYKAFNFTISSPLELPEAYPISCGVPDVTVLFDSIDTTKIAPPQDSLSEFRWWQTVSSESRTTFGCRAGVFDITDGSLITIDCEPTASAEIVRLYLMGSALGALQVQRERIPIHGGAVVSNGKAVIITGQQGAGKSTMISALVHNGFKYLTDDVSSVILQNGFSSVSPSYPQRKLIRDACLQLGYNPDELPVADNARDKFAIRDSENWYKNTVPTGMLVELIAVPEGEPLRAEPILGKNALSLLMQSLYRFQLHTLNGTLPPSMFKKILTIAAALDMRRVYVPRGINKISQSAEEFANALDMHP